MFTILKCVSTSVEVLENAWELIKLLEVKKNLQGDINDDSISFQLSCKSNPADHFDEIVSNLNKCLTSIDGSFLPNKEETYLEIDTAIEPGDISGRNMLTWTMPNDLIYILLKNSIRFTTTVYP